MHFSTEPFYGKTIFDACVVMEFTVIHKEKQCISRLSLSMEKPFLMPVPLCLNN